MSFWKSFWALPILFSPPVPHPSSNVFQAPSCEEMRGLIQKFIADYYRPITPEEIQDAGHEAFISVYSSLSQENRELLQAPPGEFPVKMENHSISLECTIGKSLHMLKEPALEAMVRFQFLKAFISQFDPHSTYFTPSETRAYKETFDPNAENLQFGFLTKIVENDVTVVQVGKNSAADKGGIRIGDQLLGVQNDVRKKVLRKERKTVFEFFRDVMAFKDSELEFQLKRPSGQTYTTRIHKTLSKAFHLQVTPKESVLVLRISEFGPGLAQEVLAALQEYPNSKAFILDLRFCGGGLIVAALEFLKLFIDGPVGWVQFQDHRVELPMKEVQKLGEAPPLPLVVITNAWTVSAAEFVAYTLSRHVKQRAILVGSDTHGKWQELEFIDGPNHDGLLVVDGVTYAADGKSFQSKRVEPDLPFPDVIEKIVREGGAKGFLDDPVYEADLPHAMKPQPDLPREMIGAPTTGGAEGDLGPIIDKLANKVSKDAPRNDLDPTLTYALRVSKEYRRMCATYAPESCPSLQH